MGTCQAYQLKLDYSEKIPLSAFSFLDFGQTGPKTLQKVRTAQN
jgi:hypothetical protein